MFDRLLAQKLTGRQMALVASSHEDAPPAAEETPAAVESVPVSRGEEVVAKAFAGSGRDMDEPQVTEEAAGPHGGEDGIRRIMRELGTLRQEGWEKTALSLGAGELEMVFLGGLSLLRSGLYSDAIERLEEVLVSAPENSLAHFYLGRCHNLLGDPVAAEVSIRNAVELEPGNPEFLTELAMVLEKLGRNTEASTCYRKAGAIRKVPSGGSEGR
jgi:tetratricopeptide (TPR) repeat protein